jgi:hypothetical protein
MIVAVLMAAGVASAAPAVSPIASREVQADQQAAGISSVQAQANLTIQHQATQVNLVGQLGEALGNKYAGVWFDDETGEFVVPVAVEGDAYRTVAAGKAAVGEEFATASLGGDYRTEAVAYNREELEGAQAELNQLLASYLAEGLVQTALESETNAVVVRVPEGIAGGTLEQIEAVMHEVPVTVELQTLPKASFEVSASGCNEVSHLCDLPVRGGERMWAPWTGPHGEAMTEGCTVGFRANGYNGDKYILTAGHCVKQESDANKETLWTWETADLAGYYHYIGRTNQWHFPGRDWADIDATGSWADTPPWPSELAYWGSTQEYPVVGEASSYKGQTLCHVGMASGTSCGIVSAENVTEIYGPAENVSGLFEVNGSGLAVEYGDSGGPIFANNIALGLVSGCHCASHGAIMYFNDITEATAELGVDIAGPGAPEAITGAPLSIGAYEATVSGQVDPHGLQTEYEVEYGPAGYSNSTSWSSAGSGQGFIAVSKGVTGLEPATLYRYRLTAANGFNTAHGAEGAFRTAAAPPTVATLSAREVKKNSAAIFGSVNPLGEPTTYQFEYGTTISYGSVVPVSAESVGAGRSAVGVGQSISGLKEGTTYHFRLRATNAGGTSYGSDQTFTTPNKPVVTAEAASYVNTLEPTMNATINPERADTHFQFEYGTTEAYGTKVPVPASDAGAESAATVERGLKGLARSTTYHYRVTAENEVGVVHGADKSFTTLPPCKGAEAKCAWSLQSPANPLPPSKFEMKSVSCSSSTLCIAVGKNLYNSRSFVDRWNGSSWSLISGAVPGEMKRVSCLGSACFAVGVSGGAATTWAVSEYPIGGGGWIASPITAPLPSGASETVFDGLSCGPTSECTAVGSYKGPEGTYHPLVERWNGTSWALQSAPNPTEGTAQNAMLSVSCISIGCMTVGEAAGKPVAETWLGGSWALSSAPKLPAGAKGGRLSSVSCTSALCIAVGNSNEGVGTEKALAESWNGGGWGLMSAAAPAEAKGFVELAGVSCPSTSACTATGYYAAGVAGSLPTELKTLAEAWNGSTWTIQSSPNAAGQKYNTLADVSCSSAGACTAVGEDSAAALGASPESLAERWNGTAWSTQTLVNPEQPIEDEMKSVSCSTNTLCVAAGKNLFAENGYAEVWNGTEWLVAGNVAGEPRKVSCSGEGCMMVGASGVSAQTWIVIRTSGVWGIQTLSTPLPSGATESVLDGVGCAPGGGTCTAVGSYKGSEGTYHPLVERWNGSAWSLQSAPNPIEGTAQNAMLGVSCAGASSCVAVGEAAGKPVAETWNGSTWSSSPAPPRPAGAKSATFAAVSCGSIRSCTAVGNSSEGAGTEKALAERWNGSAWSIVTTPAPAGAKGFVGLTDVACLSPNACFAAGAYAAEVSGGAPTSVKSLVEGWEGTEWSVLTSPNLAGQAYNALAGIACSTSIDCTAVGSATSSLSKRPAVQLAVRYE